LPLLALSDYDDDLPPSEGGSLNQMSVDAALQTPAPLHLPSPPPVVLQNVLAGAAEIAQTGAPAAAQEFVPEKH
jgi:hypothetical protein